MWRPEEGVGERAGHILGRMHEATSRNRRLVEPFDDHRVFVQLRVDPFYRRVQERLPDTAAAVEPLVERLLDVRDGLCHGDYSPKNILTHAHGFTLVDRFDSWGPESQFKVSTEGDSVSVFEA